MNCAHSLACRYDRFKWQRERLREGELEIATHTAGDPYFGWYAGLAVGFCVVVVVVAVVALLLTYATRVGDRVQEAAEALVEAREGTLGLQALRGANDSAEATLEAARAARPTVTGGR